MEFIITIIGLICFCISIYYYPQIVLKMVFKMAFMLVPLIGSLMIGAVLSFHLAFSGYVVIGHESFYTAIFIAFVTVASGLSFSYLIALVGKRSLLIIIAGIVTFILTLAAFRYGYQWEISDVLSKSCETCTSFGVDNTYSYNPSSYSFKTANACIVWDNAQATAQCFFSLTIPITILLSFFLALISISLTFFYTLEIEVRV